jgi:hypothetical protein
LPGEEALPGILLRLIDRIGLDEPYRPGERRWLKAKVRDYRDISRRSEALRRSWRGRRTSSRS